MPAYVMVQIDVRDRDACQPYLDGFMPIFERHGGELLVASTAETEVLEGSWALPRSVLLRFPSVAHAKAWHADPDDVALAEIRHRTAQTNLVVVDGVA